MLYKWIGQPVIARHGKWYKRLIPRRLTGRHNPAIYGWLCFNFSWVA